MKRYVLFFAFLWMGFIGASAQSNKYDLNEDGDVNITDVILLVNYILGQNNGSQATGEAIDLGLPSGTLWASCNVGASKPEEYGGYYAWGETEEKETYTWENYIHCDDGTYETCHDLGSDISGTEYDVAHVKWGGNWCMPTLDDIKELLDNCTSEWTTLNGVNGHKFTGPNGNSIFLPAAGSRWRGGLSRAGEDGGYWSSTQNPDYSYLALGLGFMFRSGSATWGNNSRDYGQSVRPVVRN